MLNKEQDQTSGDNSQNLQAGRDIIFNGLTYSETRDIVKEEAQKVFKQNSLVLADEAYKIVLERSKELLDNFLKKLEEKKPEAIISMRDPGMQYSLYNAQREYAKTGDRDLAAMLEDILVERAKNPKRDLLQIVLDECISVVPKLTSDQFDALSLIFILRYTVDIVVTNLQNFIVYITGFILPFIDGIRKEHSRYQHLEFSSCGTIGAAEYSLEFAFREKYLLLFSKGFTPEEFASKVGNDPKFIKYVMPCHHDLTKLQINILNKEEVMRIGKEDNLASNEISKIIGIFESSSMNEQEIKDYLSSSYPPLKKIMEDWNDSSIKNMTLTSVGVAIGHANLTRKTNVSLDLRIWLK